MGSGWGIHVKPCLILVNVWQKPLQYGKVISLQVIKINGKKEKNYLQTESNNMLKGSYTSDEMGFIPGMQGFSSIHCYARCPNP